MTLNQRAPVPCGILLLLLLLLPAIAGADFVLWDANGQKVTGKIDSKLQDLGAQPITIRRDGVEKGDANQLTFTYDVDFQALVIDTNGLMRLRHLDRTAPAGSGDNFGTSVKLPPGLRLDNGSGGAANFLAVKVKTINLVTTESAHGELRLEMTGVPFDGGTEAPVSVQWTLTIPQPQDKATTARLEVRATFDEAVTLDGASFANAEAFRAAQFSSSNVPPDHTGGLGRTHDADNFRVTSAAGLLLRDLALDSMPVNNLFFPAGIPFDGEIALNQLTPALLNGDPPNLTIKMLPAVSAPEYRAQGYITVDPTINKDSDNLGAWANRTLASPAISAGQQFAWAMLIVASDEPANTAVYGNWAERTVVRTLPPNVGDEVDIGTLTFTGGTGSMEVAVNASGTGSSVAKRYVIPIRYNLGNGSPPATWLKVLPTHDTGPYGVNDFDLDINVTNATAQLRLRTVRSSGTAATARIAIKTAGLQTFVNSAATAAVPVLPTQTIGGNAVDEVKGKAGIGAVPSANAVLDINGGNTRGLHLRPRSTLGAPTTGTWNMGTIILDSGANLYIRTAPGTPGTWKKVGN